MSFTGCCIAWRGEDRLRLAAARRHAEAARGGASKEDVHAFGLALVALAAVSGREGNTVDAEDLFKQALEIIDATAYRERSAFIRELFAELLISQGRAADLVGEHAIDRAEIEDGPGGQP